MQIIRQDSNNKQSLYFKQYLAKLHIYDILYQSQELLANRVQSSLRPEEVKSFENVFRLYFWRKEVRAFNNKIIRNSGRPILKITSEHTGKNASRASNKEAKGLNTKLYLFISTRVMLIANLQIENSLINGTIGTIRDIIQNKGADIKLDMPQAIIVKPNKYEGPRFEATRLIPILPIV